MADNAADLKQPAAEARPGDAGKPALDDESRARYRLYLGLLACALLVAFAVAAVPALRNRLGGRVQALRQAMGWESVETERAVALVGENKYEFPAELVRPAPKFSSAGVLALPGSMVFRPRGEGSARAAPEASGEPAPREEEASGEKRAPEFRQGAAEKEAFDLLLKSHEGMAALVRGSNPSLRFKTWSAARSEEDAFLVDVTFAGDAGEAHYVWKVKPSSKEVTPLSHNARALAKP